MRSLKHHILYIILVAVIVIGLAAGGVLPLSVIGLAPGGFNTTTQNEDPLWTIEAKGWYSGNTEILDSIRYITGAVGASEKIVMEGMKKKGLAASCIWDHRYDVYITNTNSWGSVDYTFGSGGGVSLIWQPVGSQILSQWTAPSGWLKVELFFHIKDLCGTLNLDKGWYKMSTDMAFIRWGGSSLSFDQTQYEVGETATINYAVGFARSAKEDRPGGSSGWTFTLYSNAQAQIVHSQNIPGPDPGGTADVVEGSIFYTIQPADFVSGGCTQGANNKLTAKLYNNLVFTEKVTATTIDERALAPPAPTITLSISSAEIGDALIINVVGTPNPTTQLPICGVNLRVFYAEGNVELVDTNLVGSDVLYTFGSLPAAGLLMIEAFVWDENARTSPIASAAIGVLDPTREPEVTIDITLLVLIMVVLIILAIVILLPLPYISAIPFNARGWISVLLAGGAVGMFIWFLVIPQLIVILREMFPFLGGG